MKPNNRRRNFSGPLLSAKVKCSCGGTSKLKVRTNYPFGRKSKGVKYKSYNCSSCGKKSPANKV